MASCCRWRMLCHVCKGIDLGDLFKDLLNHEPGYGIRKSKRIKHHRGLADLYASAQGGCDLCSFIWRVWSCGLNEAYDPKFREAFGRLSDNNPGRLTAKQYLHTELAQTKIFLCLTRFGRGKPPVLVFHQDCRLPGRIVEPVNLFVKFGSVTPSAIYSIRTKPNFPPLTLDICSDFATAWLRECLAKHEKCSHGVRGSIRMPARVIDVGTDPETTDVRLLITNQKHGSWTALSYCWGGSSDFVLKTSNVKRWLAGVPLQEFPATLRDAVTVTRIMGIRYIWIDALCILQDSRADWAAEASQMGYVYRFAVMTIAAASASSAYTGIFRAHDPASIQCELGWNLEEGKLTLWTKGGLSLPILLHFKPGWPPRQPLNPLATRGWALQETLLSPRILSLHDSGLEWQCIDHYANYACSEKSASLPQQTFLSRRCIQDIRWGFPPRSGATVLDDAEKRKRKLHSEWRNIVERYTGMQLSVATDVLPALSALARVFQAGLGEDYHAGIWSGEVLHDLVWKRAEEKMDERSQSSHLDPSLGYCIPSWSWASIRGSRVKFYKTDEKNWSYTRTTFAARCLSIHTKKLTSDPFGQTGGGHLELRAPFHRLWWPRGNVHWPTEYPARSVGSPTLDTPPHPPEGFSSLLSDWYRQDGAYRAEFDQQHRGHPSQHFGVVLIMIRTAHSSDRSSDRPSGYPLKLVVVESTGNVDNEYRRVGMWERWPWNCIPERSLEPEGHSDLPLPCWKEEEIRII